MTATTATEPCWVIDLNAGSVLQRDGGDRHLSEQEARDSAEVLDGEGKARQLDDPCVTVACATCGDPYDAEAEYAPIYHFDDAERAFSEVAGTDWKVEDGKAYCPGCPSPEQASATAAIEAFNTAHPVGTPVRYWRGVRQGEGAVGETSSAAWVMGGHSPVVRITGTSGAIALTHVQPLATRPADARQAEAPRGPRCAILCPDHDHACDRDPGHLGPHRDVQQKGTETCSWEPAPPPQDVEEKICDDAEPHSEHEWDGWDLTPYYCPGEQDAETLTAAPWGSTSRTVGIGLLAIIARPADTQPSGPTPQEETR